jgi:methionyl-tRNA synthetase
MAQVMRNCLQVAKSLALLIEPVMPERAELLWNQLGNPGDLKKAGFEEGLVDLIPGPLPAPSIIFEKLDEKKISTLDISLRERIDSLTAAAQPDTRISIEEFSKVELKIGQIIAAEAVPKSSKLLKLQVGFGTETRQIVSGIAQFYSPDELVGKNVTVVTNLKPAKIFGIESNGMILAAGDDASLLIPLRPVEPGTKIR